MNASTVKVSALSVVALLIIQGCISNKVDIGQPGDQPVSTTGATQVTEMTPTATLQLGNVATINPVYSDDYLVNPGIGWQDGPDRSIQSLIPEMVAYSNRREIAWRILNPKEGVYQWKALDDQLSLAVSAGKQFSFRVYSMIGAPYGGHMVPGWVLSKDALILQSGEPDYSNCVYQEEWGNFVNELILRYDGNPNIAFIDISGYGNFNEWSWQSSQTEWDYIWEEHYSVDSELPDDFRTLDGQARRRLADTFIGGSSSNHSCRMANGDVKTISYSYKGFQKTQLIMPYAGIAQSIQYVMSQRSDVGFRFDCLGNYSDDVLEKVGKVIDRIWRYAPVVYELCKPAQVDINDARDIIRVTHASLLHDNASPEPASVLQDLIRDAGYRYFLKSAALRRTIDGNLHLWMEWQNVGLAPNYPKMGQDFELVLYLETIDSGNVVYEMPVHADISGWLPSVSGSQATDSPINIVDQVIVFPSSIPPGTYEIKIGIKEIRTGNLIRLAIEGVDDDGRYSLTTLKLE